MTANRRAVVVVALLVVVLFFLCWLKFTGRLDDLPYGPAGQFSEGRWKGRDLGYRHHALPEVMAHRVKPGMTEGEVRAVLGEPDVVADSRWQYEVLRPGGRAAKGFQSGGLVITFSKEKTVEKVADVPLPL